MSPLLGPCRVLIGPLLSDGVLANSSLCALQDSHSGGHKYNLVGVIVHEGKGLNSGHYYSHCLNPVDGEWYGTSTYV